MGSSVVFPLYQLLLKAIHAGPGDLLLVRVHPPYVTFKVAHPELLIPAETFERVDLPEEPPALLGRLGSRGR
jgi:hypothetical protein